MGRNVESKRMHADSRKNYMIHGFSLECKYQPSRKRQKNRVFFLRYSNIDWRAVRRAHLSTEITSIYLHTYKNRIWCLLCVFFLLLLVMKYVGANFPRMITSAVFFFLAEFVSRSTFFVCFKCLHHRHTNTRGNSQ